MITSVIRIVTVIPLVLLRETQHYHLEVSTANSSDPCDKTRVAEVPKWGEGSVIDRQVDLGKGITRMVGEDNQDRIPPLRERKKSLVTAHMIHRQHGKLMSSD